MAWTIAPHSYDQAIRSNRRSVHYGRTGAYIGLGQMWPLSMRGLGQAPCPSFEQLMQIEDPLDPCQAWAAAETPVPSAYKGGPVPTPTTPAPSGISQWAQSNLGWLAIGSVLFVMFMARR
jgi:hypothetical protein